MSDISFKLEEYRPDEPLKTPCVLFKAYYEPIPGADNVHSGILYVLNPERREWMLYADLIPQSSKTTTEIIDDIIRGIKKCDYECFDKVNRNPKERIPVYLMSKGWEPYVQEFLMRSDKPPL